VRGRVKVGQTPSSARDPLIALLRPLSNLKRDRTLAKTLAALAADVFHVAV